MPNKKITVVGDGAEEPLTPEEEHRIEVRVDQMLDPALPDGTSVQPAVSAPTVPESTPAPQLKSEATAPEPKKVTKIVTRFADDDDENEAAPAAPAPVAVPSAESEVPKPKPAPHAVKPVGKKISIKHDDDVTEEEPKSKATKTATHKPKKAKKAEAKEPPKDNLETKADAITAAALEAAEAIDAKTEEPTEPVEAEVPDLPAADTEPDDDNNLGAPPLIQKHSASPIRINESAGESPTDEQVTSTPSKKISIVDNSAPESETDEPDAQPATNDEEPGLDESADEVAADQPEADTEPDELETLEPAETPEVPIEPVAAVVPTEATIEQANKYRPPEGPIQFKRAEVPIEPLKPGTPRPAETTTDALSSEDAALTEAFEVKEPKKARKPLKLSVGRSLKKLSLVVLLVMVAAAVAFIAVPTLRNKVLGLAGATADMQVTVLDASNHTPLWHATVAVGGANGTTNSDGTLTLHGVKLGSKQLSVQAYVFASKTQPVTIAWRSQNTTSVSLTATGTHYHLSAVDYVSGQPVANAKINSGPASTVSDAKGSATLVAPSGTTSVEVAASGYTRLKSALSSGTTTLTLVPAGQDIYISRSGGKISLYRNSVDGKSEQLVLSGASNTATDLAVAPNNSGDTTALVSTRDNTHDASGNLQDSLSLVTTANGTVTVVDHANTIKLVDWFGSRIVYVLSKTTTSTTDADRYQLVSYDTASHKRIVLDHTAYLNDVVSAKGVVYYATAANGNGAGQFISIKPDGSSKKVILGSEIAAITRTSFNQLALASVSKWYTYRLGDTQATPTATASTASGRQYVDSPNGLLSVYVDTTASTPKLVLYNVKTGKESLLAQAAGITYPVHWLGANTVIYRVSHGGVVTDNAVTSSGNKSQVVSSVSDIAGVSLWHE